jgi:hypothetical protein
MPIRCVCSMSLFSESVQNESIDCVRSLFISTISVCCACQLSPFTASVHFFCLCTMSVSCVCPMILFSESFQMSPFCVRPVCLSTASSMVFWGRFAHLQEGSSFYLVMTSRWDTFNSLNFLYDVTNRLIITRIPFSIFVWFRFLIKQKILSRNWFWLLWFLIFVKNWFLFLFGAWNFLPFLNLFLRFLEFYISLKLLCMNLRSGFDLWNIVAYLKSLESLKSFLIFRVTFASLNFNMVRSSILCLDLFISPKLLTISELT